MVEGLKYGDQARVAEITGFTHDYVKKVMQGKRNNARVVAVAEQIVSDRERMVSQNTTVNR